MDIHRDFAEVVALEGTALTHLGRVEMTRDKLRAFAAELEAADHVVLESTGNTVAVVDLLSPHVARVAVAN
ncbi:MAG: IS110 family transposase, partial [Marinovum algicola]